MGENLLPQFSLHLWKKTKPEGVVLGGLAVGFDP